MEVRRDVLSKHEAIDNHTPIRSVLTLQVLLDTQENYLDLLNTFILIIVINVL